MIKVSKDIVLSSPAMSPSIHSITVLQLQSGDYHTLKAQTPIRTAQTYRSQSINTSCHINQLPLEILYDIFEYLTTYDLARVTSVSKKFRDASAPLFLWKHIDMSNTTFGWQVEDQLPTSLERRLMKASSLTITDNRFLTSSQFSNILHALPTSSSSLISHINLAACPAINDRALGVILKTLPNLKSLDISKCYNVHYLPSEIEQSSLQVLDVSRTCIHDESLTVISGMKHLTHLSIASCFFLSKTSLQFFCSWRMPSQLTHLDLSGLVYITRYVLSLIKPAAVSRLEELALLDCDAITMNDVAELQKRYASMTSRTPPRIIHNAILTEDSDEGYRKLMELIMKADITDEVDDKKSVGDFLRGHRPKRSW